MFFFGRHVFSPPLLTNIAMRSWNGTHFSYVCQMAINVKTLIELKDVIAENIVNERYQWKTKSLQ